MPLLKLDFKHIRTTDKNIEKVPKFEHANFALGYVNNRHKFVPAFVGRTNGNLREELKDIVNQKREEGQEYTHFKYRQAESELEAYQKECKNYHDFLYRKDGVTKQLHNTMHPIKPSGGSCPVDSCYQ